MSCLICLSDDGDDIVDDRWTLSLSTTSHLNGLGEKKYEKEYFPHYNILLPHDYILVLYFHIVIFRFHTFIYTRIYSSLGPYGCILVLGASYVNYSTN